MARFYLDHDVGLRLARLLNEHGHDARTSLHEQTTHFRDGLHLLYATRADRIVLTHNERDYLELHHAWHAWTAAWGVAEQHRGVIVIPQDAGWGLHQMAEEVELVLDRTAAVENRLFRWTAEQGWIEE